MNTKGVIYTLMLAFFVIGILVFVLYVSNKIIKETFGFSVGESAILVIQAVQKSQEISIFLEATARETTLTTINALHQQAGLSKKSPCGESKGVQLWAAKEKNCAPRIKQEFFSLFKTKFAENFKTLGWIAEVQLIEKNYELYIENNHLQGLAIAPLKITRSFLDTKSPLYVYYFRPSFTVELPFDFEIYKRLERIPVEINNCIQPEKPVEECIQEAFDKQKVSYTVSKETDAYVFTVQIEGTISGEKIQPLQFGLILPDVSSDTNK